MDRGLLWTEVGDRVYVRRYRWLDQNIGLVVDGDEALIIDTRATEALGREVLRDLRAFGNLRVVAVVNTHGHWDHAFGNGAFRPAPIWGQTGSRTFLDEHADEMRNRAAKMKPSLAADLAAVRIDPPDREVESTERLGIGGRVITLRHLGRGHTDHDLLVDVPESDVVFVGDLFVGDRRPYFGDSYPLDWATTAAAAGALGRSAVVTGHGQGSPTLVAEMTRAFGVLANMARSIAVGQMDETMALRAHPFPAMSRGDRLKSLWRAVRHAEDHLDRPTRTALDG
jgi:glyoxylase-like metal-dependent hydrolase (beta-lactamase superfamily II)